MKNVLREYIRDENNNPVGVVVALKNKEGNRVIYGYSLVNSSVDQFNKKLGVEIAANRAVKNWPNEFVPIPNMTRRRIKVTEAYDRLEDRAVKYFKDLPMEDVMYLA